MAPTRANVPGLDCSSPQSAVSVRKNALIEHAARLATRLSPVVMSATGGAVGPILTDQGLYPILSVRRQAAFISWIFSRNI